MRLATFTHHGATRLGLVEGEAIVDLARADKELPRDMIGFLEAGDVAFAAARDALSAGRDRLALADVRLEAPVPRPPKFLAVGLNYADHVAELPGREKPDFPVVFNKQSTSANGPFDVIHRPSVSRQLDYEGELGFVVGRRCRHVSRAQAPEVIAGYVVVDDVSVRDWQRRSPTMTLGKSFDTHGPFGPWIVTPDEISDPHALAIKTWVNGEPRQDSSTRNLMFDCFAIVETLSTVFTLEVGDVVSTGTPGGVGAGMKPPRYLEPGDVVRVEIEGIGAIENRVVDEPVPATPR